MSKGQIEKAIEKITKLPGAGDEESTLIWREDALAILRSLLAEQSKHLPDCPANLNDPPPVGGMEYECICGFSGAVLAAKENNE